MLIREDDHQALQTMYHFENVVEERDDWFADRSVTAGVPKMIRTIGLDEMDIPIRNQ